jgi:hypothetical protein
MRIQSIPLAEQAEAGRPPIHEVDAEEAKLIKGAGMGYLIVTAKHHDGFAM